jgi:hypothetical protein
MTVHFALRQRTPGCVDGEGRMFAIMQLAIPADASWNDISTSLTAWHSACRARAGGPKAAFSQ